VSGSYDYEVVVVGGGPAGLAAATWLARYRCHAAVVDSGEYRNRWVDEAHGYLGFDPLSPAAFLEGVRKDLGQYRNLDLCEGRVLSVSPADGGPGAGAGPDAGPGVGGAEGGFSLETSGGSLRTRRVVLATGTRDVFPEVEGFLDHYGADVFHCPTCDGYEAQGKRVVVLGWDSSVAGFSLKLLHWADGITVVTQGHRFEGDEGKRAALAQAGIDLLEDDAARLVGRRGELRAVELSAGGSLPCDLVFFSLPNRPVNDLAGQLGCDLTAKGHVVIDGDGVTSRRGVFAAGDLTPGEQLIQVAAAQGTLAGIACAGSLAML
jgi:thioredoxin reductase